MPAINPEHTAPRIARLVLTEEDRETVRQLKVATGIVSMADLFRLALRRLLKEQTGGGAP